MLAEVKIIDSVAKELKVGVVDVHAALQDHQEMIPDKVHPNTAGAGEIAKAVHKALTGAK